MRWIRFLRRLLAWDGALPAIGLLLPRLIFSFIPDTLAVLVILAMPMSALFLRAQSGLRQFKLTYGERVPWFRRVAFAAALLTLLIFDFMANFLLSIGAAAKPHDWETVLAIYLLYLVLIITAMSRVFLKLSQSEVT